jgi:hypothetical protein
VKLPDLNRATNAALVSHESKPIGPYCTDCGRDLPAEAGEGGRMVRVDDTCREWGRECGA